MISKKIVENMKDCHGPTGARVFVDPANGGVSQKATNVADFNFTNGKIKNLNFA